MFFESSLALHEGIVAPKFSLHKLLVALQRVLDVHFELDNLVEDPIDLAVEAFAEGLGGVGELVAPVVSLIGHCQ